ncbi:MAG: hypothetical protein GEU80_00345 [Dehalococcoidia bacterium]|nr:hypothetical protein [Dehalococcoidia bacterium]
MAGDAHDDPSPHPSRVGRRRFLGLAAGGLGAAVLAACSGAAESPLAPVVDASIEQSPTPEPTATPPPTATPTPTPTPRPVPPAGREVRALLAGTEWETPAILTHSGQAGPSVLILGGVHGNEPGGWTAAEAVAEWEVQRGSLIVVPRANVLATLALERTFPELGDLNRLYPGTEDGLPMERMALAIVNLAREQGAEWLLDMHESWGFYNERGGNSGTAFIGQTVAVRAGLSGFEMISAVVDEVNASITEREQLTMRGRTPRSAGRAFSRATSLSLNAHVPGLTPVLIEMGQQDQAVTRRAELHQLFARALLQRHSMV